MTLGEDVADEVVQCETVKSVLGLTGVSVAQSSADNKDHKVDQEGKNPLRLVEAQNALTYTKHGSVMAVNGLIAN